MKANISLILPAKSLILIGCCAAGIFAFALLAIFPAEMQVVALKKQIANGEARLKEQQLLYPLYDNLKKKARFMSDGIIAFPEKSKLSRADREQLQSIFQTMAERFHLKLKAAVPDISSLAAPSELLTMNLAVEGDFLNFRDFLIELCRVPYLEHIGQIEIGRIKDSVQYELNLKLLMAQE